MLTRARINLLQLSLYRGVHFVSNLSYRGKVVVGLSIFRQSVHHTGEKLILSVPKAKAFVLAKSLFENFVRARDPRMAHEILPNTPKEVHNDVHTRRKQLRLTLSRPTPFSLLSMRRGLEIFRADPLGQA